MPTAAKLVAAVLFGALAWAASRLVVPLLPEGTDVGFMAETNAAIGAVTGWRVAGPRARTTVAGAAGYGLTAAFVMALAALFAHSFAAMVRQSLRRAYDGPVEALAAVFAIMAENARLLAEPRVAGTLLVGGVAAGLVTEWTGRRFS